MADKVRLTNVPLADIVEDTSIYPRHAVDDVHTSSLYYALAAGSTLPPPVLEAGTFRIVDGWHRVRALRRFLGTTGQIKAEIRSYSSEAELLEDAISMNASHGRRLDKSDQTRAVLLLQRAGVTNLQISAILHVPEERVTRLSIRVAESSIVTDATIPGTRKIALKRSMAHLAGKELTAAQAAAHDGQPGTSHKLLIRQLIGALKSDCLNRDDLELLAELQALHDEIAGYLERMSAVAA